MKKREVTFLLVALILGAVLGGVVGDIICAFLPDGAVKTLLSINHPIGVGPSQFDFYAISFTFGLQLRLNFMSALVILLVIIYFRWWYL
jgi:hypothetical protein